MKERKYEEDGHFDFYSDVFLYDRICIYGSGTYRNKRVCFDGFPFCTYYCCLRKIPCRLWGVWAVSVCIDGDLRVGGVEGDKP